MQINENEARDDQTREIPVSYTHLDVYKRQALQGPGDSAQGGQHHPPEGNSCHD